MKLLLLIPLFIFQFHCFLGCHDNEREALLNFKSLLTDPSGRLSSWEGLDCCAWHGINCSNTSHVISIDLHNPHPRIYFRALDSDYIPINNRYTAITGKVSPSLFTLRHLEYLDLSFNDFNFAKIPSQFNNLERLTYLNVSNSMFSGSITTQFANLSSLRELDLSCSYLIDDFSTLSINMSSLQPYFNSRTSSMTSSNISCSNLDWLRGLVNLRSLILDGVNLSSASVMKNWAEPISFLRDLRQLLLSNCEISSSVPVNHLMNLTHLTNLSMSFNFLTSLLPVQLANLTSLSILYLSNSHLQGAMVYFPQLQELRIDNNPNLSVDLAYLFARPWQYLTVLHMYNTDISQSIPPSISNATSLSFLFASSSFIQGPLPYSLFNLSNLWFLDLGNNNLTGNLPASISRLKNLQHLFLYFNKLSGQIPNSICQIASLRTLHLQGNGFTGSIPNCIGGLPNLEKIFLRTNAMGGNPLSLTSFFWNSTPYEIDLSSSGITVKTGNYPFPSNFQPRILSMGSCSLGGKIPDFISGFRDLGLLDLSNNSLTGTIPFWLFELPKLAYLDLSDNKLQGVLPSVLQLHPFSFVPPILILSSNNLQGPLPLQFKDIKLLRLSQNNFTGQVPAQIGQQQSEVRFISLSGNKLSGEIPRSLCQPNNVRLQALDLSNNELTGMLPSALGNCNSLMYLNVANNSFTGNLPSELGYANSLRTLQLNDNQLIGPLPDFIWNLQRMEFLILGNNKFNGSVPPSIGNLRNLRILVLRSNSFSGSIPNETTQLQNLQFIDLSHNKFSGPIPAGVGNFKMLTQRPKERVLLGYIVLLTVAGVELEIVTKGSVQWLPLVFSQNSGIDLSDNIIEGKIPKAVGWLQGLYMLNLSKNAISGSIPSNLGNMSGLESLDLSFNSLDGKIPEALVSLDYLSVLRLAYNNLSGKVPSGPHFDTLSGEGLAYAGNPLLCGPPVGRPCTQPQDESNEGEDAGEDAWLPFESLGWGYLFGLLGPFLFMGVAKGNCCDLYWRFVERVASKLGNCLPRAPIVSRVHCHV